MSREDSGKLPPLPTPTICFRNVQTVGEYAAQRVVRKSELVTAGYQHSKFFLIRFLSKCVQLCYRKIAQKNESGKRINNDNIYCTSCAHISRWEVKHTIFNFFHIIWTLLLFYIIVYSMRCNKNRVWSILLWPDLTKSKNMASLLQISFILI